MSTVSLSAAWIVNEKWAVRAVGGIIIDGNLQPENESSHDFEPGGLVALGVEYRASTGLDTRPSIDLSFFLSASWSETSAPTTNILTDYFAADARLGARFSWVVNNNTYPYIATRVFGGPVNWNMNGEEVTGTDIHHYQVALGVGSSLGKIGLFAEWAALGEKALSAGISTAF